MKLIGTLKGLEEVKGFLDDEWNKSIIWSNNRKDVVIWR